MQIESLSIRLDKSEWLTNTRSKRTRKFRADESRQGMRRIPMSRIFVSLILLAAGCSLYQPRPITYTVRDGDTGRPIEGAKIKANYLTMLDFGVLFASIGPREGITDRDGELTLIIDPDKISCHLSVTADGYPIGNGRSTVDPRFCARKAP